MYPYEPVSEFSVGQWNVRGQRLYPAMSDSAVCSYPFPNEFSMNPAFSMYPVLPPTMYSVGLENNRRSSRYRRKSKAPDAETSSNNNANFTSLPPVNHEDIDCSQKRRFSDPGLNNAEESNDSSSSESISDEGSLANESLVDQINELKSENKRLYSELESTRTELKMMRSEIAVVANKVTCHEPISLARKYDNLDLFDSHRIEVHSRIHCFIAYLKTLSSGQKDLIIQVCWIFYPLNRWLNCGISVNHRINSKIWVSI